ncbi:hypothetical protein AMTRI_Chr05g63100 [Amborella trichopoda]|uniref:putative ATPase N2B isoform X1 n=1 Tax=Amborella trichopoda TaxID=13333 RepID=UPI0005D39CB9|nr:putative ATPase N2B isoform X1 [Amborella trichopoda]|eukprot:XP_011621242.1 putative ATPase N2B isoform X1 [Amborella trichopoda]
MRRLSCSAFSACSLQFLQNHRILSNGSPKCQRIRVFCHCSESSFPEMSPGPLSLYRAMVNKGKLQYDRYQERVASELEGLLIKLGEYEKDMQEYHIKLSQWEKRREEERHRLLMQEAELKQQGDLLQTVKRHRSGLVNKFILRSVPFFGEGAEPGVGKMVSYLNREKKLDSLVGRRPIAPAAPKGLYLYGSVGSGKTMLMDMFYNATMGIVKHRRRFHFHEAMLEIHEQMHKHWKKQVSDKSSLSGAFSWIDSLPFDTKIKEWLVGEETYQQEAHSNYILPAVADRFLVDRNAGQGGASILCFDEIQTVDVFAVVALSGIVSRLLSTGTVLVATSNRAPTDLNQDGMQKEIFLRFVAELEDHCRNILVGSEIDYRRLLASKTCDKEHYFWPLDRHSYDEFERMWHNVTMQYGGRITSTSIPIMFGRTLEVPESCNGVSRFTFDYLCGRPVGAADYIAIANNFHTVFISDIPMMSMRIRDKARRFITLVDELYNHHCCLFCSAAASVDDLFQGKDEGTLFDLESFQFETETEGGKLRRDVLLAGNVGENAVTPNKIVSLLSGQEEMFAFRRAVSRLIEMQTPFYLYGVRYHSYFQRHQGAI